MMEIQKIKQRNECCRLIVKVGLGKTLTKTCKEEDLLAGCRDILDVGMSQACKALPDVQQMLLIKSGALRKTVLQLFQMGAAPGRVGGLLAQMDEEEISEYPIERLYDVLSDDTVHVSYIALHFRYYADMDLMYEKNVA